MSSLLSRQILSVNTATAAPIDIDGRRILSGIGKRALFRAKMNRRHLD